MLNINFQQQAIKEATNKIQHILQAEMRREDKGLLFVSSVGSGKTYMASQIMQNLTLEAERAFVWLSPGTGGLAEQSKQAFERYSVPGLNTLELSDVLLHGLQAGDVLFANWEKLKSSEKNLARKEGEQKNLDEQIQEAVQKGLQVIVFIDEAHVGQSDKSYEVLQMLQPSIVVELSATPKNYQGFNGLNTVMVDMADVIAEQFLKNQIVVNADVSEAGEEGLLRAAVEKQRELQEACRTHGVLSTPLCLIQIENATAKSFQQDAFSVSEILTGLGVDPDKIAIKLSDDVTNYADIVNSNVEFLIFKQAISTGWDVPRSHILVRLRDIKSPTFDLQTLGRILRTVEKKHYGNALLDSAYLYSERDVNYSFDAKLQEVLGLENIRAKKTHFPDLELVAERRELTQKRLVLNYIKERFDHYFALPCPYVPSKEVLTTEIASGNIDTTTLFDQDDVQSAVETRSVALTRKNVHISISNALRTYEYNLDRHLRNYIVSGKGDNQQDETDYFYQVVYANQADILTKLDAITEELFDRFNDFRKKEVVYTVPEKTTYSQVVQSPHPNYAYDKEPNLSKELTKSASEQPFANWLNERNINWFKNGVKKDNFSIVYEKEKEGEKTLKTYYPDFIFVRDNVLHIVDTKAPFGTEDYDDVPEKYGFGKKYEEKHREHVQQQGFADFKFSIVKFDKRMKQPYILHASEYTEDFAVWEKL